MENQKKGADLIPKEARISKIKEEILQLEGWIETATAITANSEATEEDKAEARVDLTNFSGALEKKHDLVASLTGKSEPATEVDGYLEASNDSDETYS